MPISGYGRRCQSCGSGLRDGSLSGLLTGKYLTQARLSHLLAIPGMLIFLVGFTEFGILSIVPLNIVAPLITDGITPQLSRMASHDRGAQLSGVVDGGNVGGDTNRPVFRIDSVAARMDHGNCAGFGDGLRRAK